VGVSVPGIRRIQLGRMLREFRERSSLTLEQAAPDVDISRNTLSRIERAGGGTHPMIIRALLELYDVNEDEFDEAMMIAREARQKNWYQVFGLSGQGYIALETEAVAILNYQLAFIPGLLQTEDYARVLMEVQTTKEVNRHLGIRMNRRVRLTGENALDLHLIVDESALMRVTGSVEIMVAQLRHLTEVRDLPNVRFQVLPLGAGNHLGLRGGFSVLRFPPNTIGDIAHHEHPVGSLQIADQKQVGTLRSNMAALSKIALDKAESLTRVERIAEHLERGQGLCLPWT
jgi:transcriptional regulator with XRE-family HTH domain